MRKSWMARLAGGAAAAAVAGGMLLGQPAVSGTQQAEAAVMQYYLTSVEPGYACSGCCYVGLCCKITITNCEDPE